MGTPYDDLRTRLREVETLVSVAALLSWDQETMMPPKAAAFRAEELALMARMTHERAIDPAVGELIEACEQDAALLEDPIEAANLREIRRDYDRARRLPPELVQEMSETSSHALEHWKQARAESDFSLFAPWLAKQIELCRRKAECHGTPEGGELYDQLLEDFEPGMTAREVERVFEPLRAELVPLIAERASNEPTVLDGLRLPVDAQRRFHERLLSRMGYDLDAGRLDVSTHPFTTGIAPGDTRITTRFSEDGFSDGLGSTLHEMGHALYEQGLPKDERHGQPLGQPPGLGMHESQSRLWENQVGRSRAFWIWAWPLAQDVFGEAVAGIEVDELVRALNRVRPSLVRVESDETTYNLHIMIRFDIERALMRGDLAVDDVPGAWNQRIRDDLGIEVPDDARGCLQDIHWSMGSIGYFPTYTLGNLHSAQLWEAALAAIPDLESGIARGEFGPLLEWLRDNVHRHGRRFRAADLCRRITGNPIDHTPLIRHLRSRGHST
jgi:carboxypeptidase Taq